MTYMLDTNICSYILKDKPIVVRERLKRVPQDRLAISTVVVAELLFGAEIHPARDILTRMIDDLTSRLAILEWDENAARHYAAIRAHLKNNGCPIGNMDMMIAAHARSLGATLVSNNLREFDRVPGLLTENWAQP